MEWSKRKIENTDLQPDFHHAEVMLTDLPDLGVAVESTIDDADIRLAVGGVLVADDQIPENKIDVDVEEGIVILSGTVSNLLMQEHPVQTRRWKPSRGCVPFTS